MVGSGRRAIWRSLRGARRRRRHGREDGRKKGERRMDGCWDRWGGRGVIAAAVSVEPMHQEHLLREGAALLLVTELDGRTEKTDTQ